MPVADISGVPDSGSQGVKAIYFADVHIVQLRHQGDFYFAHLATE